MNMTYFGLFGDPGYSLSLCYVVSCHLCYLNQTYSVVLFSNFILFYYAPFYSSIFCSILFYSILFYSMLYYSTLLYTVFYCISFCSILPYSILFHSIVLHSMVFCSIPFYYATAVPQRGLTLIVWSRLPATCACAWYARNSMIHRVRFGGQCKVPTCQRSFQMSMHA